MRIFVRFMGKEQDILRRQESAMEYFRKGYNCCQSVLLAFSDITGLDTDALSAVGCGLGGGVARMRDVCGSVSAMAILAGFISPAAQSSEPGAETSPAAAGATASSPRQDGTSTALHESRKACYSLVQQLAGEFRGLNGSIVCRELLGLRTGTPQNPVPQQRDEHYYQARPCERLVGDAAGIFARYLYRDDN